MAKASTSSSTPPTAAPKTRTRNTEIVQGVRKMGRSRSLSATGRFRFFKKGGEGKKEDKKAVEAKAAPEGKFYAAVDRPTALKLKNPNASKRIAKLRKTIEPGTVLIVLAGRFRGKRVVFLKQLQGSGLLLVTGPFAVNGVPIRRINQAYCIATSTKVNLAGVELPADLSDAYFKRVENDKDANGKATQINADRYAKWMSERRTTQKSVDSALTKNIAAVPQLKEYLAARFSLSNGQAPHAMKF